MPPTKPTPKPKPKPKKDEAVRLAEVKLNAYMGHLKRMHNKESLGKKLNRAINPFDMNQLQENFNQRNKVEKYENAIDLAKTNARSTAEDNRHINPSFSKSSVQKKFGMK